MGNKTYNLAFVNHPIVRLTEDETRRRKLILPSTIGTVREAEFHSLHKLF